MTAFSQNLVAGREKRGIGALTGPGFPVGSYEERITFPRRVRERRPKALTG